MIACLLWILYFARALRSVSLLLRLCTASGNSRRPCWSCSDTCWSFSRCVIIPNLHISISGATYDLNAVSSGVSIKPPIDWPLLTTSDKDLLLQCLSMFPSQCRSTVEEKVRHAAPDERANILKNLASQYCAEPSRTPGRRFVWHCNLNAVRR